METEQRHTTAQHGSTNSITPSKPPRHSSSEANPSSRLEQQHRALKAGEAHRLRAMAETTLRTQIATLSAFETGMFEAHCKGVRENDEARIQAAVDAADAEAQQVSGTRQASYAAGMQALAQRMHAAVAIQRAYRAWKASGNGHPASARRQPKERKAKAPRRKRIPKEFRYIIAARMALIHGLGRQRGNAAVASMGAANVIINSTAAGDVSTDADMDGHIHTDMHDLSASFAGLEPGTASSADGEGLAVSAQVQQAELPAGGARELFKVPATAGSCTAAQPPQPRTHAAPPRQSMGPASGRRQASTMQRTTSPATPVGLVGPQGGLAPTRADVDAAVAPADAARDLSTAVPSQHAQLTGAEGSLADIGCLYRLMTVADLEDEQSESDESEDEQAAGSGSSTAAKQRGSSKAGKGKAAKAKGTANRKEDVESDEEGEQSDTESEEGPVGSSDEWSSSSEASESSEEGGSDESSSSEDTSGSSSNAGGSKEVHRNGNGSKAGMLQATQRSSARGAKGGVRARQEAERAQEGIRGPSRRGSKDCQACKQPGNVAAAAPRSQRSSRDGTKSQAVTAASGVPSSSVPSATCKPPRPHPLPSDLNPRSSTSRDAYEAGSRCDTRHPGDGAGTGASASTHAGGGGGSMPGGNSGIPARPPPVPLHRDASPGRPLRASAPQPHHQPYQLQSSTGPSIDAVQVVPHPPVQAKAGSRTASPQRHSSHILAQFEPSALPYGPGACRSLLQMSSKDVTRHVGPATGMGDETSSFNKAHQHGPAQVSSKGSALPAGVHFTSLECNPAAALPLQLPADFSSSHASAAGGIIPYMRGRALHASPAPLHMQQQQVQGQYTNTLGPLLHVRASAGSDLAHQGLLLPVGSASSLQPAGAFATDARAAAAPVTSSSSSMSAGCSLTMARHSTASSSFLGPASVTHGSQASRGPSPGRLGAEAAQGSVSQAQGSCSRLGADAGCNGCAGYREGSPLGALTHGPYSRQSSTESLHAQASASVVHRYDVGSSVHLPAAKPGPLTSLSRRTSMDWMQQPHGPQPTHGSTAAAAAAAAAVLLPAASASAVHQVCLDPSVLLPARPGHGHGHGRGQGQGQGQGHAHGHGSSARGGGGMVRVSSGSKLTPQQYGDSSSEVTMPAHRSASPLRAAYMLGLQGNAAAAITPAALRVSQSGHAPMPPLRLTSSCSSSCLPSCTITTTSVTHALVPSFNFAASIPTAHAWAAAVASHIPTHGSDREGMQSYPMRSASPVLHRGMDGPSMPQGMPPRPLSADAGAHAHATTAAGYAGAVQTSSSGGHAALGSVSSGSRSGQVASLPSIRRSSPRPLGAAAAAAANASRDPSPSRVSMGQLTMNSAHAHAGSGGMPGNGLGASRFTSPARGGGGGGGGGGAMGQVLPGRQEGQRMHHYDSTAQNAGSL